MFAYNPHKGCTSMFTEYKFSGRNLRWFGLSMVMRKDASVISLELQQGSKIVGQILLRSGSNKTAELNKKT
jgi:hypothetical protein